MTHGLFQPDVQVPELVRRVVVQGEHILEAVETRRGLAERVIVRETGVPGERPDVDRRRDNIRHFEGCAAWWHRAARDGCYRVWRSGDRTFVCVALQHLLSRKAGFYGVLS